MRILHVPHAYAPVVGGAELIGQRVSEILAARGHQVRVVTGDVGAVQGYYSFGVAPVKTRRETICGVEVFRIPYGGWLYALGSILSRITAVGVEPLGRRVASRIMRLVRWRFRRAILREIENYKPDVVMALPHLVVNVQAVLAARRRVRFPLVMVPMLHEHDPHWPAAEVAEALKCADAVLALTRWEAQRLSSAYGVPTERIFVGSVGIDVPATSSSTARRPAVLFLGRNVLSKGIGELLHAMRLVWHECPDAELIIAGVRVPETSEIDALIQRLPAGLRKKVISIGAVPGDVKACLLESVRCLVLPSRVESFGMVILDAWAHGTPVVVLDLPVFREIVEQGKDGLLARPGDPRSLANSILQLLTDVEAAERMGRSGREKAVTYFSWERVASVYENAYQYAVSHPRTPSRAAV